MRITSVSFGYTKNMGNYESMRVDATVELLEGEDFDTALALAAAVVNEAVDNPLDANEQEILRTARINGVRIEKKP